MDGFDLTMTCIIGVPVLGSAAALIFYMNKNNYTIDDNHFLQAGVDVDFSTSTIVIKGNEYNIGSVKGIRWSSGAGEKGNISYTYIEVNDFNTPSYRIDFITPNAAEHFAQRLCMAIEKAGGPTLTF